MILYEDFDLRIQSDGHGYVVRAQRGSQVVSEPFALEPALLRDVLHLEAADPKTVRKRGAELFDALIHGHIRDLYQQARGHARKSERGLRIRLIFNPRDERLRPLVRLPFEILCDRMDEIDNPPALDARRPIVRTLETIGQPLTAAPGPLQRVLLAVADPFTRSDLDFSLERTAIETALARISITPVVVDRATRSSLFDVIADTNAQIVHFIGHSDLEPETGEGALWLESDDDEADRLPGSVFAGFFLGRPAPRLVILTSCLSAARGDAHPFAGIAFALVAAGLPAVIAMQSRVQDDSAIRFTERLYRRLSDGAPIEAAVADARRALSIAWPETLEWASPVLFMRDTPAPMVDEDLQPSTYPPVMPAGPLVKVKAEHIGTQIGFVTNYYNDGKNGR